MGTEKENEKFLTKNFVSSKKVHNFAVRFDKKYKRGSADGKERNFIRSRSEEFFEKMKQRNVV